MIKKKNLFGTHNYSVNETMVPNMIGASEYTYTISMQSLMFVRITRSYSVR